MHCFDWTMDKVLPNEFKTVAVYPAIKCRVISLDSQPSGLGDHLAKISALSGKAFSLPEMEPPFE